MTEPAKALAPAAIITEIARYSGTQFDPAIVAAFIRIADAALADLA
jgi:response regulator RpfG family c-di-GMP phosphodiesterase